MSRKHQLGISIPYFSKALQKRRIRGLSKKLSKLNEKICDLDKRVEVEKEKASILFTKAEYDNFVGKLDETLESTCECAKAAASTPTRGGKPAKGDRECADEINRSLPKEKQIPKWDKKRTAEQREMIRKCQEADLAASLSGKSCRRR